MFSKILDLFNTIEDEIMAYKDSVAEQGEEIHKLNQGPDTSDQEFIELINTLLDNRKKAQDRMLDARMKMVSHFSEDEWRNVLMPDDTADKN